jgi:hypothetical protein
MPFIRFVNPDTGQIETDEVEITARHADGSFDYRGSFSSGYRAREKLVDAFGNSVAPALKEPVDVKSEVSRALAELGLSDISSRLAEMKTDITALKSARVVSK